MISRVGKPGGPRCVNIIPMRDEVAISIWRVRWTISAVVIAMKLWPEVFPEKDTL